MLTKIIASTRRRLDPDALAYAAAATTAGATISESQRAALSAFVASEKQAGRWSLIKALYLPVWAVANANRINLVSLATGTWSGTPTHSAGFVKGNGINAYFVSELSPSSAGLTTSSAAAFVLMKEHPAGTSFAAHVGPSTSTSERFTLYNSDAGLLSFLNSTTASLVARFGPRAADRGVIISSRIAVNNLKLLHRNAAGFSVLSTSTASAPGTVPTAPLVFMGSPAGNFSSGEYGVFGVSAGMSEADAEAFTLSLKTLWEALSGLVLP
jgi:hypothetical protein